MTPQIYVCISAFDTIRAEAEVWRGKETGGILLGYETTNAVVITHATGPGPNCRRTGHSIQLDARYIQGETDRLAPLGYQYQGSWHTHPTTGLLFPSPTDRRLLRAGAWSPRYRLKLAAIMLITRDAIETVNDVLPLVCSKHRVATRIARLTLTRDLA